MDAIDKILEAAHTITLPRGGLSRADCRHIGTMLQPGGALDSVICIRPTSMDEDEDSEAEECIHLGWLRGGASTVKYLDLCALDVGDDVLIVLSRPILALTTLEGLNLNRNQIGDEGMMAFSGALSSGSLGSLAYLNLDNNRIGDAGMIAFANAIKPTDEIPMGALASLKELSLWGNEIGDSGMIAFADAIKPTDEIPMGSLDTLTWLNLDVNQIGDEGMKAFSSALSSGSLVSLTYLDLSNNRIGDEGTRALSSVLISGALQVRSVIL